MWFIQRMGDRLARPVGWVQRAFRQSPPAFRRGAAMLVDAAIVIESFAIALLFRFNGQVLPEFWNMFWPFAIFAALAFVLLLNESKVYQSILRYTGIYQGVRILSATAIAVGGLFITDFVAGKILGLNPVPLSVILVGGALAYLQLVAVRLYPRVFYELSLREVGRRTRIAIVGTEEAGVALAGHIWRTAAMETQVVGFVSESPEEVGRHIEGATVLGVIGDLEGLITKHGLDQIIIAKPQASREEMDWIWRTSIGASAEVKVMPDLGEFLAEGTIKLRELQIEDLLGREPVDIDLEALSGYINGKQVLVTGAGGSIGKELSRQISRLGPARLILLDRDESGLYYLNQELRREDFHDAEVFVGDVTIPERVSYAFEWFRPQLVFHAAAYKHVPMMELQATEAITNNVFGTLNVARAAGAYAAAKFINVSTDKAVNPVNVMGATKRLAEMLVKDIAGEYLEIGRPVRITDLAKKMIEIMGAPKIQIKFIGLRPGEKLKEELFEEGEERKQTEHPMVFRLVSENMSQPEDPDLSGLVDSMVFHARSQETGRSLEILRRAVPNYSATDLPETRENKLNYPPQR